MYEHKCRDKEEADQNVNRNANTSNSKQIDKVEQSPALKMSAMMSSEPHFLLPPRVCHLSVVHQGPTGEAECGGSRYPFIFGCLCLCMWIATALIAMKMWPVAKKKKVRMCFRSWLLTAVIWKPSLSRTLAFMQRCIYMLRLTGRQIIPAEHKHPGQSSRGLDQGACELMWGREGSNRSNKKRKIKKWGDCPPPPPPFTSQVFENLAKERIVFLRNAVWTHLNQLSQQCVTDDEVGALQYRQWQKSTPTTTPPCCAAIRGGEEVAGVLRHPERHRTLHKSQKNRWKTARYEISTGQSGVVTVNQWGAAVTNQYGVLSRSSGALWELLQQSEVTNSAASTARQVRAGHRYGDACSPSGVIFSTRTLTSRVFCEFPGGLWRYQIKETALVSYSERMKIFLPACTVFT